MALGLGICSLDQYLNHLNEPAIVLSMLVTGGSFWLMGWAWTLPAWRKYRMGRAGGGPAHSNFYRIEKLLVRDGRVKQGMVDVYLIKSILSVSEAHRVSPSAHLIQFTIANIYTP